jgi:hypothetical protein
MDETKPNANHRKPVLLSDGFMVIFIIIEVNSATSSVHHVNTTLVYTNTNNPHLVILHRLQLMLLAC